MEAFRHDSFQNSEFMLRLLGGIESRLKNKTRCQKSGENLKKNTSAYH